MTEFTKRLNKASIIDLIPNFKRAVVDLQRISKNKNSIVGLNMPTGWVPLLSFVREGILSGSVDSKGNRFLSTE